MTDTKSIPVTYEGTQISNDGRETILRFMQDELEIVLTLEADDPKELIVGLANAEAKRNQIRHADPTQKHMFKATRWEIGVFGDDVVFTFRTKEGAELAFRVGKDHVPVMLETLQTILRNASSNRSAS